MSSEDQNPTDSTDPPVSDRRREHRVHYTAICLLQVMAPVWAMMTEGLPGETEDITANGMRINFSQVPSERVRSWLECARNDQELKARIDMPEETGLSPVMGQIVWIHPEGDTDSIQPIPCAVGILFSVMKEKELQAVLRLLERLS